MCHHSDSLNFFVEPKSQVGFLGVQGVLSRSFSKIFKYIKHPEILFMKERGEIVSFLHRITTRRLQIFAPIGSAEGDH